jgi:hypothetical protein
MRGVSNKSIAAVERQTESVRDAYSTMRLHNAHRECVPVTFPAGMRCCICGRPILDGDLVIGEGMRWSHGVCRVLATT